MKPSKQKTTECISTTLSQLESCKAQLLKEKDLDQRLSEIEGKIKRAEDSLKSANAAASEAHTQVGLLIGQEDELRLKIQAAQKRMEQLSEKIALAQGGLLEKIDANGTKMLKDIPVLIESAISKDRRWMVQLVLVSQSDGVLMGLPSYWTIVTPDGPVIIAPSSAVRPDMVVIVLRNNEQKTVRTRHP